MMWFVIRQILSTVLECLWLSRKSDREKDLEILLLRRQLDIVDRARDKALRVSRAEKLTLAVLAVHLKSVTGWPVEQVSKVLRIFQPATVFKWHHELVRRKWTYQSHRQRGRPRTKKEIERLIVRLARENRDWPTEKHFASWLGLAPHNDISGGKVLRSRTLPTSNRAGQAFRQAATPVSRTRLLLGLSIDASVLKAALNLPKLPPPTKLPERFIHF